MPVFSHHSLLVAARWVSFAVATGAITLWLAIVWVVIEEVPRWLDGIDDAIFSPGESD